MLRARVRVGGRDGVPGDRAQHRRGPGLEHLVAECMLSVVALTRCFALLRADTLCCAHRRATMTSGCASTGSATSTTKRAAQIRSRAAR
eukprot:23571-Rhodomonas_salina.2